MRKFKYLCFLGVALILSACANQPVYRTSTTPVKTVASVDLNQYLGQWYEIYRIPNWFEDDDCHTVTAQYSLRPDGHIKVVNTCLTATKKNQAEAIAKVVEGSNNAKLKVSFFRPFYGDYWILDLAQDYSWVLVGEPTGKYFWILARERALKPEIENSLIAKAEKLGFQKKDLIKSKNDL